MEKAHAMSKNSRVTFFLAGGAGFIGRHLLKAFNRENYTVRCLARTPEHASVCKREGSDTIPGDVTDRESLSGCLVGAEVVVHLVGLIADKGNMTFERIHVEGTRNIVDEARHAGVRLFFYQSTLGASLNSPSRYLRTKAEAEEIVRGSGIPHIIFRPSLVVGGRDKLTEKLREVVSLGPVVPVPGDGNAKFQPLDVDDWVKCFMSVINNDDALGKTYEFGGPEHITYNEVVTQLMDVLDIKKTIIHLPVSFARAGIPFIGIAQGLGKFVGKKIPSISTEELNLLNMDNICDVTSVEDLFGFKPITYKEALKKSLQESA